MDSLVLYFFHFISHFHRQAVPNGTSCDDENVLYLHRTSHMRLLSAITMASVTESFMASQTKAPAYVLDIADTNCLLRIICSFCPKDDLQIFSF